MSPPSAPETTPDRAWSLLVAAVAVTVVPVALLALQAATLLAVALPAVPVATVQVTATVVAGAGAVVGVRRTPPRRLGLLRSTVRRVVVLAALALVAGMVVVGPGVPLVGPETAGVLVVLAGAFAAGQGVGDAYRRQVRVAVTAEQRREADRSLPFRLLVATGCSLVLGVLAELVGVAPGGASVARWLSVLVLVAGVVGIAGARHLVLRARVDRTVGPRGATWRRGVVQLGLMALVVVVVGVAALQAGGGQWLARTLPDPPGWPQAAQVDRSPGPRAERQRPLPSAPEPWQVAAVVGAVVLWLVLTRRRSWHRRPSASHGQRLPLWELLRSLLAALRPEDDDRVGEEVPVAAPAPTARDERTLPAPLRDLAARLRPRPRAPAAAILHDYRAVQRRLDATDRRRAAETPLRHAGRLGEADLRELADLVCAIRYAGRPVTGDDADRSRELVRRLRR